MEGWVTAAIVILAAVFVLRRACRNLKARREGKLSCSDCSSANCEGCPLSGSEGRDPSEGRYNHLESVKAENGDPPSPDA